MNIFVRMLRDVYKITDTVVESPPRVALQMFGGPFDIETFRKQINICQIVSPPFVSYSMLIEERVPNNNIEEVNYKNVRGSVRGLRRPSDGNQPRTLKDTEDICNQPQVGVYEQFLKTQQDNQCSSQTEPPAKKTKKSTTGLAKFACQ